MYRKVVVGFRDSEHGREALALGRMIAGVSDADLVVVTAPDEDGEDLLSVATTQGGDLLVIGSTHRGAIGRVIPGSTIEHLLGESPCAIAVAPPGFGSGDVGVRVIGVGFDGTPASRVALEVATDMALAGGAALRVFTVARKHAALPGAAAEPGQGAGTPSETEYLRGQLHEAVTELPPEVRALPVFLRGFAADELVSAAKLGVDLLVLGSRRGGPLRRAAHHSVTSFVVNEAPCPVLVCPSGVPAPRPALA